jgi:hypothetical protein
MRIYDKSGGKPLPDLDAATLKALGEWCTQTRLRSDNARNAYERDCMADLRQYAGIPTVGERNIPIDNAPNIEITIGALCVETIYASFIELVTQAPQLVTVIPRKGYEDYADAVQDFIDWGCREAFNLEQVINVAPFECVQLGTMAVYIPYAEKIRVTDTMKVIDRGPRCIPLVLEDFHLPEGSQGDIQTDPWVEMDIWVSGENDLRQRAKFSKWNYFDVSRVTRAADIPELTQRRYDVSRDQSNPTAEGNLYHLCYRCAEYDIDDDGINEEIEIIWDKTSGNVLDVRYPTYQTRPFEMAVYQIRNRVAWGLGVQRMCAPYEEEISLIHNERTLNMRLANSRIWKASRTIAAFLTKLWPGKVVEVSRQDEFSGEAMADIYPSSEAGEMMTLSIVERRTGISDQGSSAGQRIGTRTPGMSTLSFMQEKNRRFTPPFRNMRNCLSAAVRQCIYRVQERVRLKDKDAIADVINVLGQEKGLRFLDLCETKDNLIDAFDVQITAASVSANREADRQNFVMLLNLWQAFQKQRVELKQFETMAPTQELKELAAAIEKSGLKLLRRIMRTFETISDVDAYLAEVKGMEDMAGNLPPEAQQGLQALAGLLQQAAQQRGPEQGGEMNMQGGTITGGPPPMTDGAAMQ